MNEDVASDALITIKEASKILRVHRNTLRRWSDIGLIKAYRIGPRGDRRYRRDEIVQFLQIDLDKLERSDAKLR